MDLRFMCFPNAVRDFELSNRLFCKSTNILYCQEQVCKPFDAEHFEKISNGLEFIEMINFHLWKYHLQVNCHENQVLDIFID